MTAFNTTRRAIALLAAAFMLAAPALAEKPEHAGGKGKGNKQEMKAEKQADKQRDKAEKRAEKRERQEIKHGAYFNDEHRTYVRQYYTQYYAEKHRCPPGLAKKNNGCMPPGQARKWQVGQPIPAGVAVYSVPQPVIVHLPPAPYGYRYARVGGDIVLVQVQGNIIVDIIQALLG
ncbi:MAG: RcnB family protein [Stagnimonas sp.]|nr:RcnB family protein [Stagnimonas sp.]